jgi:DNA-binding beta-propeller fold protein YncE
MRKRYAIGLAVAATIVLPFTSITEAQIQGTKPLVLTDVIHLDGVKGRFDHFCYGHRSVFVSALGNNTIEVVSFSGNTVDHVITGDPHPEGLVYSPEANELFAGSEYGKLYIFDGTSYKLIKTIEFGGPGSVDNLRYDAAKKRVYVGYGENERGAIGTVDAMTNERLEEEYTLGAHPEAFELETSGPNIYVNLPDLKQIAVINRSTHAIKRWPMTTVQHNFPMALDEEDHRLFVGTHEPARMAVFDTNSGRLITALPSVQDTDDIDYDPARKRIYEPGGEGYISVFQQIDPNQYFLLANVPSAVGARTAGYFGKLIKGFDRFYLAVPEGIDHGSQLWVYTVQD